MQHGSDALTAERIAGEPGARSRSTGRQHYGQQTDGEYRPVRLMSFHREPGGGLGDRRGARGAHPYAVCAGDTGAVDFILTRDGWWCAGDHQVVEMHVHLGRPDHADRNPGHDD